MDGGQFLDIHDALREVCPCCRATTSYRGQRRGKRGARAGLGQPHRACWARTSCQKDGLKRLCQTIRRRQWVVALDGAQEETGAGINRKPLRSWPEVQKALVADGAWDKIPEAPIATGGSHWRLAQAPMEEDPPPAPAAELSRQELLAYLHCSQSRPARHARLPSGYHCSRVLHS